MVEGHQGRGCFPSVGPRLGSVDPYLVRDLGLPALDDHVGPQAGPVGPVVEASGGSSQSSGGPAVKFQLGETQPFVPVRIVKRILQGHYVDMAELSEENLGLELRRGSEEEEGKTAPVRRLKEVPSFAAWTRAFCIYAGVVISAHPSKAKDLLAYMAMLSAGSEEGDWWRGYDRRFRQQLPDLESANFGKVDQTLYARSILTGGAQAVPQRAGGVESRAGPAPKRRKSAACYAWNDGRACVASPCRFAHICARCGGEHKKPVCPLAGESSGPPSGLK